MPKMNDKQKIAILEKKVDILKNALWFYANGNINNSKKDLSPLRDCLGQNIPTLGKKARKALKQAREL